jgi:hypothetical protein
MLVPVMVVLVVRVRMWIVVDRRDQVSSVPAG